MKNKIYNSTLLILLVSLISACAPKVSEKSVNSTVPETYKASKDSANSAQVPWKVFYTDPYLANLIDTALKNNQELNIFMQEMAVARNEVSAKKGAYLPNLGIGVGAGADKVGEYTRFGALEANHDVKAGTPFPEPMTDFQAGAFASWEVDIWKKLRNAKKASMSRYLATVEGKNLMITNLVDEIANAYYELLAQDKMLAIVEQYISIQSQALEIVILQKQSAKTTELAVKRFEAQLAGTKSLKFKIKQTIIETENELNFLLGRFPQKITRTSQDFSDISSGDIEAGIPSQLLQNRPDIRQSELEIQARKLDIKSARANFYPSLNLKAGLGLSSFGLQYLVDAPASIAYNAAGELIAPLLNRKAIKAVYYNASAKQVQSVYMYEKTVLNAHYEVINLLSKLENLNSSYVLIEEQVEALKRAVDVSNKLFRSARADYMEVLLTQRDALESRFDLVETKQAQLHAKVNVYRALGGGWK
ncbi:MAG: RND transporter [Crocinitomicaceae bacterium]|nr:RND transporter [Crocinitomicaceae bacterium]|tara:strand:- start:132676 stop:134103 length:1428 start_codon:yes stop_codon:yes gene_type:complete